MRFDVYAETEVDEEKVRRGLKKSLEMVMHIIETESVRLCPVDTGRLRNSIHLDKVNDYKYILADGVEYGILQEFGTIKMRPQPFFRPALDYGKRMLPFIIENNLR